MDQKLRLRNNENFVLFDACYLYFETMSLILKLDQDMMGSKVMAENTENFMFFNV